LWPQCMLTLDIALRWIQEPTWESILCFLQSSVICTSRNPAPARSRCKSFNVAAPPIQPQMRASFFLISSGSLAVATISEMAIRPPGLRTRNASSKTANFSGERLITQFEMMTSTELRSTGKCSISPRRNSTLVYPP